MKSVDLDPSRRSPSPRPLWRVIALSLVTGLLYYGWYKWVIQEELRAYNEKGWSGNLCLLPFVLGVTVPSLLATFDPDVPQWFGALSIMGVIWIYIVQFRLYCDVNALYREEGLTEPLVVWWLVIPGLNLVVGLRQIHFLSQFWARKTGQVSDDPVADRIPLMFDYTETV
ncbi:MAG: hypothetical protein AAF974_00835 [Cyanobacteria bacterium P01_E01_bin.34]